MDKHAGQEPNGFNFYTEDSNSRVHQTVSTYGLICRLSFNYG